jgi:predicted ATPase
MHIRKITLLPEKYPSGDCYPFNLHHLNITRELTFDSTVTFFVGDNGSGKSTLLRAIAHGCGIHIWEPEERRYKLKGPITMQHKQNTLGSDTRA